MTRSESVVPNGEIYNEVNVYISNNYKVRIQNV